MASSTTDDHLAVHDMTLQVCAQAQAQSALGLCHEPGGHGHRLQVERHNTYRPDKQLRHVRVSAGADGATGLSHGAVRLTTAMMLGPMAERGVPLAIIEYVVTR